MSDIPVPSIKTTKTLFDVTKKRGMMAGIDHAMKIKPQILSRDSKDFKCVFPSLQCEDCNHIVPPSLITYAEEKYYDHFKESKCWWDSDFISSFGNLLYHSTHSKKIAFIDCLYPTDTKVKSSIKLSKSFEKIVAVGHCNAHYALIHINIKQSTKKEVIVYDGIGAIPLSEWNKDVKSILERYSVDVELYLASFRYHNDFDYGGMQVSQNDGNNCSPIACMAIWQSGIISSHMKLM
jgi:hypothetical protein